MANIVDLKSTLKSLGVTGHVKVINKSGNKVVYIDRKYFGTWSPGRKTFVD